MHREQCQIAYEASLHFIEHGLGLCRSENNCQLPPRTVIAVGANRVLASVLFQVAAPDKCSPYVNVTDFGPCAASTVEIVVRNTAARRCWKLPLLIHDVVKVLCSLANGLLIYGAGSRCWESF